MMGWQWHQLDHMQIICTSLQTDNYASTSSVFIGRMLFLPPNQRHQSVKALEAPLDPEQQQNNNHFTALCPRLPG